MLPELMRTLVDALALGRGLLIVPDGWFYVGRRQLGLLMRARDFAAVPGTLYELVTQLVVFFGVPAPEIGFA